MKYVNVADAKEQFADLVGQIERKEQKEIFLTHNGKPIVKMIPVEEIPEKKRRIGIAKNVWNLPPDFDEKFDAMDEEILRSFLPEVTK